MKTRFGKVLCTAAILLGAGLFYALLMRRLGFGIPCLLYSLTGLKCPGCGVSRMCLALLGGDLRAAFAYNRAALLLLPAFVYVAAAWCVGYVRSGSRVLHGVPKVAAWGIVTVLIAFGIARNFLGW